LKGVDKQHLNGGDKQYFKASDKQYFNGGDKQCSEGDKQGLTWINSTLKVINIISKKVINSISRR
jgi:hypothetical protein